MAPLTDEDILKALTSAPSSTKKKKKEWSPPYKDTGVSPEDIVWNPWLKEEQRYKDLIAWAKRTFKGRSGVRKLQETIQMPLDRRPKGFVGPQRHSGKWGKITDYYFKEFVISRSGEYAQRQSEAKSGAPSNWVATETGVVKMTSEQADKYAAEQQYDNMLKQRKADRQSIEEDMFGRFKEITGVTATEANVNWMTDRKLKGWGYDDFYFHFKDTPEMKEMYPGIRNGMLPSEYNQGAQVYNDAFMDKVGRPLTRKELGDMMKGGDFPDDSTYFGQPAIRDEEIR